MEADKDNLIVNLFKGDVNMVSDLEIELDDNGNITRVNFEVFKCISSMDDEERGELLADLVHLSYHIVNDQVDIALKS